MAPAAHGTVFSVNELTGVNFPGVTLVGRGRRYVERRIAVEEAERLQPERDDVDGHHRPVLGPGDVVHSEHVPQHDVGVLDGPVGLRPLAEPGVRHRLVMNSPAGQRSPGSLGVTHSVLAMTLARFNTGDAGTNIGGNAPVGTSL